MMNRDSGVTGLIENDPSKSVALLMAGGDGTRLLELTREIAGIPIPKQYCRLLNNASLLEATLARTRLFAPPDRINVIVNENHRDLAMEQLHTLPKSNIFVQPQNRDTGPGMIFALLHLEMTHPDAIVAVFPTDHFIDDDRTFVAHTLRAVDTIALMPDKIAILGIAPDQPETGYGYILPDCPVGPIERAFHVKAFVEKPNLPDARNIIAGGGLWNTFVMVFKLRRMLDLLHVLVPHEITTLSELRESPQKAAELYRTIRPWNFSTRVLARISEHLIMLEVDDVYWNDWGTRESIERTYRALNLVPSWNLAGSVSDLIPDSKRMIRASAAARLATNELGAA
jgi:mannose-1-phosphate guanylyltransferase